MKKTLILLWAVGLVFNVGYRSNLRSEVVINNGDLSVLFRDNSKSPRILSGIQSLFNLKIAEDFDAYDPHTPGASAGLNFEHIISGHKNPNNKFTPRHGRYSLSKLPDGRSVMLTRKPDESPWAMQSTLKYTVTEPHYIDFEFDCTPHEAQLFGKHRHAIFFFANYMNDVDDVALHFKGIESPGKPETWITADAPEGHHPHWRGGGTYRHINAPTLKYDNDLEFCLNSWSYDYPRFTKPFYYGRAANDMVFIIMFDRTHSQLDEIRFSLFKFKLENFPRPAWDFQYVIHNVQQHKQYGFKGRLVWKKFVSEVDCLKEYETWDAALKKIYKE
ncbi:MAG: hypothetical protein ACYS1A_08850 [Planctomycetota bacterium]|jgi:hypothetical protein